MKSMVTVPGIARSRSVMKKTDPLSTPMKCRSLSGASLRICCARSAMRTRISAAEMSVETAGGMSRRR
jgi:hypothetical protein